MADASTETNTAPTVIGMDNETMGTRADALGIRNEHAVPASKTGEAAKAVDTESDVTATTQSPTDGAGPRDQSAAKLAALWHAKVGNAQQACATDVETFDVTDLAWPKAGGGIGTAFVPFWVCKTFDAKALQGWLESYRLPPSIDLGIEFDAIDASAGFIACHYELVSAYCTKPIQLFENSRFYIYWPDERCMDFLPRYSIHPGYSAYSCDHLWHFLHNAATVPELRDIVLKPVSPRTYNERVTKYLGRKF